MVPDPVTLIPRAALHAIILTFNEEMHVGRCIDSIAAQCESITVIDSGSNDRTIEIARERGAEVLSNAWVNHANQINFGIDQLSSRGGWLLRIDADEIFDEDSRESLNKAIASSPDDVDGVMVQRRIYFLGRRICHGGIEPSWQLRLWRNGRGRCEQRWMDEHIQVAGRTAKSEIVLSDINLNSLTWWTAKHNGYASREAIEILNQRSGPLFIQSDHGSKASPQARRRRFIKEKIYSRLSPGGRAILYFLYRYVLRCGFLDGREGLYFHLMQGLWYRTLVDAKVTEIERHARVNGLTIHEAIRNCTGVDITLP